MEGEISSLGEDAEQHAATYLNESPQVREAALKQLRKFLNENPEINGKTDIQTLLAFLRCCKFDVEKTKIKMRTFYEMRVKIPEWFSNRDPNLPEIRELLGLGVFVPILHDLPEPMVVIIRTGAHDPGIHKQRDVFKTGMMLLDLATNEHERSTIYGVCAVFDMSNISYGHAKQLTPSVIRKAVFAWQHYFCRPQKLEFINAPVYINVVLNVFRAFMSDKMKNRIHVHWAGKGFENLHKVVSKEILPEEYGGTNGQLSDFIHVWKMKVLDNVEWYKEDEKYKANLRP